MAWSDSDFTTFTQGLWVGIGSMIAILAPFFGLAIEARHRLPPSRRARRFATMGGESAAAYVLCFVAFTLARNAALHAILLAVTVLLLLISLALLAAANRYRSGEHTRVRNEQSGVGMRGDQIEDAE
jgi:hypothetical protein